MEVRTLDWTASVASGTPKPPWADVPAAVRARVEEAVGPIAVATSQPGGFTPSATVRARLVDGGTVFVKAADGMTYPIAAEMHRTEATAVAGLAGVPEVPRLLDWFELDDWVVLMLEGIDGRHPRLPWRDDDLQQVLDGVERLSERLTPAPVTAPTIGERLGAEFRGWRTLRDDPAAVAHLGLPWAPDNLEQLAAVEERWAEAAAGETLLHADLRADQILLTPAGLRVVDWPHVCVGAAWIDPLILFPSVELQGGPDVAALVERCELTAAAPRDRLVTVAAAMTGYFLQRSTLPDPPGIPTVRSFQRAQGIVMARWLETVLDVGA